MRLPLVPLYISLILFTNSHSKPPLGEILNVAAHDDQQHDAQQPYELSAWRGIVAIESSLIKNIWLYAHTAHATTQLSKKLFHVEVDEELFITSYEPYARFTLETIISLIQSLHNGSLCKSSSSYKYKYTHILALTTTFQGNKSPARLKKLIKLIKNSLTEEQHYYPTGTTMQILLALLYLKSQGTKEMSCIMVPKEAIYHPLEHNMVPVIVPLIYTHYYKPNHPPKVAWARRVVYKDYPPISDCVETAIRNVINELMFDDTKKQFLLEYVPPHISEQVKEFYVNFASAKTYDEVNHPDLHQDWLTRVSNLESCIYRKEGFEIHPSADNFFSTLCILLGIEKAGTNDIPSLINKFCAECSRNPFITINFLGCSTKTDTYNHFSFSLYNKNNSLIKRYITVHIKKDHAWMTQETKSDDAIISDNPAPSTISNLIDYDKALMHIMPRNFETDPPFTQNSLFFSLSSGAPEGVKI